MIQKIVEASILPLSCPHGWANPRDVWMDQWIIDIASWYDELKNMLNNVMLQTTSLLTN